MSAQFLLVLLAVVTLSGLYSSNSCHAFRIEEATIDELQAAFKHNQLTSRQLVEFYLKQIQESNPVLKGVIEVNPDALVQADRADYERKANKPCSNSGLHGIPILVKDNIGTKDKLNTTAGSFALLGSVVPRDAGVVMKLRKAGAIILGKASLSEWASFRSVNAPNGWSARGGQGKVSLLYYRLILLVETKHIVQFQIINGFPFCRILMFSLRIHVARAVVLQFQWLQTWRQCRWGQRLMVPSYVLLVSMQLWASSQPLVSPAELVLSQYLQDRIL